MSEKDYTISPEICQGDATEKTLKDVSAGGHERPWAAQRKSAEAVAELYRGIDYDKAERMQDCAGWLKFGVTDGGLRLLMANFCRVRLCPMCQWRRSLKVYGQMVRVFDSVDMEQYAVVGLNLTLPNCTGDNLGATLDRLIRGFKRLMDYKDVAKVVKGFYRAVEVTVNANTSSKWFETLHPHIHSLLIVRKSYFTSRDYISFERWRELWERAAKHDNQGGTYPLDIKVWRVYVEYGQTIHDALKEFAKYTVKTSDITDSAVDAGKILGYLDMALANRRFIGLGGILKDIHKQLNLSDAETSDDLVHVDGEELPEDKQAEIYYIWRGGVYIEWDGGKS